MVEHLDRQWRLTVGFYDPQGNWHPESDYSSKEEASERVAFLNGYPRSWMKLESRRSVEEG
jgi:hypothetical protein